MKELAKSIIIHIAVGVVIFACAVIFFNYRVSREKGQDFSEMANATFPMMEISGEDGTYDLMSGYVDPMDFSLVRNQIALFGKEGNLDLILHPYGHDITAIQYTLYENSEKNELENGTLNQLEDVEEDNTKRASIQFTSVLQKDSNYYLKMKVRLDNQQEVYFYTKLLTGEGYHFHECVEFAMKFHENLFNKEKFEENITYLEPSGKPTKSFESVDITSSVDTISFGSLLVNKESIPRLSIKEINDVYTVLQLDYILSAEIKEGVIQYYNVTEKYKIRYTSDRMYLLDYERNMDAYYNKVLYDSSKNYITLGIGNINNIDVMSSDDGNKVCFSQAGQFWYYNYKSSDVCKVYSFPTENLADLRNTTNNHDIKILNIDEEGNIIYVVYGYMNRGHYEGKNGIQLIKYNAKNRYNEELAFFSTSVPFERMRADVEKITFLNGNNIFYCLLDGDLHAVDIEKKEDKILYSGMINENITASVDESIIAIEDNKDLSSNQSIRMINLETGEENTFTCGDDKRIHAVGFLSNDFIYGIADKKDVKRNDGGRVTFPMRYLSIVNIEGQELKRYKKSNRYILETEINGRVLEMEFGRKNGNKIAKTSDRDYIRYKEEEQSGQVSAVYDYSSKFLNQVFLRFPNYVYIQIEPDLIMTKVLSAENSQSITLERTNESKTMYYVYAEGNEIDSHDNLRDAILDADELRGNVISSEEKKMWECGYLSYAMVAGMDQVTKVKNVKYSLAGCLEMIAKVNGNQASYRTIDTKEGGVTELIAKYSEKDAHNLEGCSMDEILYFVSKGSPVLAKYNSKRYIIIMSYNSSKVRYLDPVSGQSTAVDRKSLENTISKAGNKYYTYY
ncbi:MAG: hypothetical protein Q4E53_11830 [Eubacteriales bacterium]|nr:hypothetical protein [Eubacteriales bacterium]